MVRLQPISVAKREIFRLPKSGCDHMVKILRFFFLKFNPQVVDIPSLFSTLNDRNHKLVLVAYSVRIDGYKRN